MSHEIAKAYVVADGLVGVTGTLGISASAANATTPVNASYVWSKSFPYMAIGLEALLISTSTQASQTVVLQASDTAGSFSSPTSLAVLTISSSDTALTKYQTFVAASAVDLAAGQIIRVAHVATATDSVIYKFRVLATPTHY